MASLTLDRVSVSYPNAPDVLNGVTLDVDDGELVVLLGASGCGKTTTLRTVVGLVAPSSGDVQIDGVSMVATRPEDRGAVMVFQQHLLFPFRSVGDNVGYGLKVRKVPRSEREERVAAALAAVQLDGYAGRWPDELSGGERQRVALARALVVNPTMMLLDEPLSNLDQELRSELGGVIKSLQANHGITTLMVTHDRSEARRMADRVAVMIDGSIRQVGEPAEVADNPLDADVARYFGAA